MGVADQQHHHEGDAEAEELILELAVGH